MDHELIKQKFNTLNKQSYDQGIESTIKEYLTYINDDNNSIEDIYYELLNFTGIDIPSSAKTIILTTLFRESEKLRKICFDKALLEVKDSLSQIFDIQDESYYSNLRDALLGKEFVKEGYNDSSWDDAISLLDHLNMQKIMSVQSMDQIVFWSKINNHELLNDHFLTIENSSIGPSMYFLDLVFSNWSSDSIQSPKLEEFWKKLSQMFTKNTLIAMNNSNISSVNFYFEKNNNLDFFGDIFLEVELPLLLRSGVSNLIVHIVDKDLNQENTINIDLSGIRNLGNIDSISPDTLKKYLMESVVNTMGGNRI